MTKRQQIPSGLRPLTPAERKRIARENARALFPQVLYQRFEATIQAVEARLKYAAQEVSR